ncbi:hypothetical protein ABBQ32_007542 [Trebouxia sp. C0010 RCD-2024]
MDLKQQVKNSYATERYMKPTKPVAGQQTCTMPEHRQALQRLSNGQRIPYDDTLRIVNHHCTKFPRQDFTPQHKAPGYIRNQLGGFFTS